MTICPKPKGGTADEGAGLGAVDCWKRLEDGRMGLSMGVLSISPFWLTMKATGLHSSRVSANILAV